MTVMAHLLIRLDGDEDWATWGSDWRPRVDEIASLHLIHDWHGPPAWLAYRGGRQLDWGATLYELPKPELLRLIRADISEQREDEQRRLLDLPETDQYGVVWIEIF